MNDNRISIIESASSPKYRKKKCSEKKLRKEKADVESSQSESLLIRNIDYFKDQNYSLLVDLYENLSDYKCLPIIDLINNICDEFNKSYKDSINKCMKMQLNLDKQDKLAINFIYIAMNILSKFINYNYYQFDDSKIHQLFTGFDIPRIKLQGNLNDNYSPFNFDDKNICQLFTGLDSIIYNNKNEQQLCEAILYAMCKVFVLSNAKMSKNFSFEKLKKYENGNVSEKLKTDSFIILICTELIDITLNRKLMSKLMNIKWENDKFYLGFSEQEILDFLAIGINIENEFLKRDHKMTVDENLSVLMQFGYKEHENYEKSILNYLHSVIEKFRGKFLLILQKKLGHKKPLDDKEKEILNTVCNTFTIYGQFRTSAIMISEAVNIFKIIMEFLKKLKPIKNNDMIASRICEIILYCLCNLAQNYKSHYQLHCGSILYQYFIDKMSSPEIKIASAVSILLLKIPKMPQGDDISKFLIEIKSEMERDCLADYFGFSLDEINKALSSIVLQEQ